MTIKQHFENIDHPVIRARALANMWWEDAGKEAGDLSEALYQGFNFARSPEGGEYWMMVYAAVQEELPADHFLKLKKFSL